MPRQIQKHPECIYGNKSAVFCVNPNCKKPAFICEKGITDRNQCGLFHETCQKMSWTELDNIIYQNPNTRTVQFNEFIEQMETFFSNLIRKIKEEHLKFKVFIRTFGYSDTMMKFIQQINNEDFDKITGHHLNYIISQLFIKDETTMSTQFTFNRKVFEAIGPDITECFNKISSIYKRPIDGLHFMESIPKLQSNSSIQNVDSKITNNFEFIGSLFPPNRKIKKFNLIFRASENGFSAEKFHQKCDNTPNTLVLVENQFGKIIGGYTALNWNSSKKHWTTDKDMSSFIFSVSLRQKFTLDLSQFAIACNQQKGPIFGCCDICIVDRSDRQICNAQFPISYNNFKRTRSIKTNLQFVGNETAKFRTNQWQVFEVQFENN